MAPARIVAIVLVGGLLETVAAAARAAPDCRCVHAGRYYNAGELACINTANGPRLARCSRVSNLSSWKFLTDRRCGPSARWSAPRRSLTATLPTRPE